MENIKVITTLQKDSTKIGRYTIMTEISDVLEMSTKIFEAAIMSQMQATEKLIIEKLAVDYCKQHGKELSSIISAEKIIEAVQAQIASNMMGATNQGKEKK